MAVEIMMEKFLLCFWGNMKDRNKETYFFACEFCVLTFYEPDALVPETVKTEEDKKGVV